MAHGPAPARSGCVSYCRRSLGSVLGLLLCVGLGTGSPAAKGKPLPYKLGVRVTHGKPAGPAAMRADLRRGLLEALNNAACFESVRGVDAAASNTDLLLEVVIIDIEEETRYDISMATLSSPNTEPGTDKQLVATVRGEFHVELLTVPASARIRSRKFIHIGSHRPILNEDPRAEARWEMLNEAVRSLRVFACKGSEKKVARAIEQARTKAGAVE